MTSSTPIAFVDTETTHLSAEIGEVWEVAVILRENGTDTEYTWQFAPDLGVADPESLKIGRFEERFVVPVAVADAAFTGYPDQVVPMTRESAARAVVSVLSGAILVGSNPGFDDRFLRKLVGLGGAQWNYRPIDIATLAAGYMWALDAELMAKDPKPINSKWLSRQVGVEPPAKDVAHTALGDARWARDVYDAITGGKAVTV